MSPNLSLQEEGWARWTVRMSFSHISTRENSYVGGIDGLVVANSAGCHGLYVH